MHPKEQRPGAVRSGTYREIDIHHPEPRCGTRSSLRSRQTRHHRLRQARGNHLSPFAPTTIALSTIPRAAAKAAEHPAPVHAASATRQKPRKRPKARKTAARGTTAKHTLPSRCAGPRNSASSSERRRARVRGSRTGQTRGHSARHGRAMFDRIIENAPAMSSPHRTASRGATRPRQPRPLQRSPTI